MFVYQIITCYDHEKNPVYGLFLTTKGDDGQIIVVGSEPVGWYFDSVEELTSQRDQLTSYLQDIKSGDQQPLEEQDVEFIEFEDDCGDECCGGDCNCDAQSSCDDEECWCQQKQWWSSCACDGNCSCGSKHHNGRTSYQE